MGPYNTMNNVKSKQLRDALERERIKNTELQNNLESLATKTNEQLDVIKEQNKNRQNEKEKRECCTTYLINPRKKRKRYNLTDVFFDIIFI